MAITFVAVSSGAPDDDSPTTVAINTTGASVLCAIVTHELGTGTFGDSAGNTWTELTVADPTSPARTVRAFYCLNPITSATHTFTFTGTQVFGSVAAVAFAGTATSSALDQQATNASNASAAFQFGSVTPSEANEVCISLIGAVGDDVTSVTGATLASHIAGNGLGFGNAIAYTIQTTATAYNPTANQGSADVVAGLNITFKVAGGGGGATPFGQSDWPVPRRLRTAPLGVGFTQARSLMQVEDVPVGRGVCGPAPDGPRYAIERRTWTQARPTYYVEPAAAATPFVQTDWSVPGRPRPTPIGHRGFIGFYVLDQNLPFLGTVFPVPGRRPQPVDLRSWMQGRPILAVDDKPFIGTAQPVPAPRPSPVDLRMWLQGRPILAVEQMPFPGTAWSAPGGRPYPIALRTGIQTPPSYYVDTVTPSPFNLEDWPVPVGRAYPVKLRTWHHNFLDSVLSLPLAAGWGPLLGPYHNRLVRGV